MHDYSFHSKYKYIRKLGQGGSGEVFLAENQVLGSLWAIKEVAKGSDTSITGYIEPEILKRLNHPALPRICDVYEDETKIYIVEDFIEGTNLKQELDCKGKFEEQRVVEWAIQLCSVLDYLHNQKPNPIIYGDLKPHNIILTKEGFIKLIDFGVSTQQSDQETSLHTKQDTAFIGTKGYAAPEQFLGSKISCASDIYSLGITIIQLITGMDPIKAVAFQQCDTPPAGISQALYQILLKCIEIKPQNRYLSTAILLKEFQQYLRKDSLFSENEINQNAQLQLTKIIAVTGAKSTGVSTITIALAECVSGGNITAGILDLSLAESKAGSLETGFEKEEEEHLIYNQIAQMKDKYSYIFIDLDIRKLKFVERYINHVFIVSDMNPKNIYQIGKYLDTDAIAKKCMNRCSFIINKFYTGELSARTLLISMFLKDETSQSLQDLIAQIKVFEVSYDHSLYLKWMYSYFEEQIKSKNILTSQLKQEIQKILTNTISTKLKKRKFNLWRKADGKEACS